MHPRRSIARRLIAFKDRCSTQADSASDSLALFYSFNLPFLFLSSFPPSLLSHSPVLALSRLIRSLRPFSIAVSKKQFCLSSLLLSLPNLFSLPLLFLFLYLPLRFSLAFPLSPEFLIVWKGHLSPRLFHPSLSSLRCTRTHKETLLSAVHHPLFTLSPNSLLLRCFRSADYSCASSLLLSLSSKT